MLRVDYSSDPDYDPSYFISFIWSCLKNCYERQMFSLHFSHLVYQVEHNVTILYQMFFYKAFQRPSGVHSIQTPTQIQRFVRFFFFEAEILPILFFRTLTNKVRK